DPAPGYFGNVTVQAAVTDGFEIATAAFHVSIPDPTPVWNGLHDWTMVGGQRQLIIPLSATSNYGPVSYGAQLVGAPPVSLTVSGNQLLVEPSGTYRGSFGVVVTASNGLATAYGGFAVTVPNAPPVLAALADQTMSHALDRVVVYVDASDANGDPLTYSARL